MKNKSLMKRMTSFLLTVILLFSAIPVSLAVQNMVFKETTSEIVREITELREESSKQFLCEDGSIIVATYSEPVHFFENGEWKEINNELTLTTQKKSSSGKATYVPKRSGISISIPQTFSDGQQITAVKDNYAIKFSLDSGNSKNIDENTTAIVSKIETLPSNLNVVKTENIATVESSTLAIDSVELANEKMMEVENKSGAVVYKNILPDTDLEYIVSGCSVKENIIVNKAQSEYNYSFDIDIGNLISVKNENGSISLYETIDSETPVFHINAPYMYDSNGIESPNVDMSLVVIDGKTKLILNADKEWINSSERVFPVVIDPTFTFGNSAFEDVFVMDGVYANSTRIGNELRVGKNLTNTTRTYIKMNLPTNIPRGSEVTSASLTLKKDAFFQAWLQDDIKIYAYDGKDADDWSPTNITWNNQPNFSFDHPHTLDKIDANEDKTTYTFNILDAVSRWVEYGENNGICLKSSKEDSKTQIDFHSSRVSDSNNRPVMTFTYLLPGLSVTSWNTGTSAAFSPTINVTAAPAYEIRCSESWLSPTSKTDSSFKLHVTRNDSAITRTATATIILKPYESAIGTVTVTQLGVDPHLMVDTERWNILSSGGVNSFDVISNTSWSVEVDYNNNSACNWIHIPTDNATGNSTIAITVDPNSGKSTREATVKIKSGELLEKIDIVQYDELSEKFIQLNIDNTVSLKSSSEYNHSLATWAMKLSYAAYNYPDGTTLPNIPGDFMNGLEDTAADVLQEYGFGSIVESNYSSSDCGAHTIACRDITLTNFENIQNNNTKGDANYVFSGNVESDLLYNNEHDRNMGDDILYINSGSERNVQLTDLEDYDSRPLVVVAIRGSVTKDDWLNNFKTQFVPWDNKFEAMKDVVAENLSSYISDLSDPIILVTGHSLGAAIANLLAAELSETMGVENVYAYTFGTPNVLTETLEPDAIPYTNIYNILNTNDVVTYVPFSFWIPVANFWSRHGIDISLNMPYSEEEETDFWGLKSHSMAVYMAWMEDNPNMTHETILAESVAAKTRGLLPRIVRVKCPVSVSVNNSNGNLIAFETQEDVLFTQAVEKDTGIVSWIDDDGAKVFFIPAGAGASNIEIEAYDYGTMDLSIGTAGTTDETEIKVFNDVSLYPGKEFLVNVSEDVLPEDTQLYITENGEIVGEVTETDPPLKGVTVNHEEKTDRVVTYLTFVTDNTVSEIRFYKIGGNSTSYIFPTSSHATVVEDGDNLIWTAGYVYNTAGDYSYDVSVKSGEEWHYYENVFAVHIPQEYIDIKNGTLETNSIQTMSEDLGAEMTPFSSIDDI